MRALALSVGVVAAMLAVGVPGAQAVPSVTLQPTATTVAVGQDVAFTATPTPDEGVAITSLDWAFGDGATADGDGTNTSVTHAYTVAGTYTATVTTTDAKGVPASASATVDVVGDPAAAFTFSPPAPNTGDTVSFDGAGSTVPGGSIASYAWDFGDGATGTGVGPSHSYGTPGDKTVTLTVANAVGRTASVSQTVRVNSPPVAASGIAPAAAAAPTGAPVMSAASASAPGAATPPGAETRMTSGPAKVTLKLLRVRIQLAGSVSATRTRITRLLVIAPQGAIVAARCRGKGKGCPATGLRRQVRAGGRMRLAVMERWLRAGARIVVSVAKPGFATRRIVLTMRAGQAPSRHEACMLPTADGKVKEGPCPAA